MSIKSGINYILAMCGLSKSGAGDNRKEPAPQKGIFKRRKKRKNRKKSKRINRRK